MTWNIWGIMLAQCIFFYIVGYSAGKKSDPVGHISEATWLELQKHQWDHPLGGGGRAGKEEKDGAAE